SGAAVPGESGVAWWAASVAVTASPFRTEPACCQRTRASARPAGEIWEGHRHDREGLARMDDGGERPEIRGGRPLGGDSRYRVARHPGVPVDRAHAAAGR